MTTPETYHWPANDLFVVARDLGVFQTAGGNVYTGRGTVMFADQEIGSSKDQARLALGKDLGLYEAVEETTYKRMEADSEETGIRFKENHDEE